VTRGSIAKAQPEPAFAVDRPAEIWPAPWVVNGGRSTDPKRLRQKRQRPPVWEFMILTEFSHCQEPTIERVSAHILLLEIKDPMTISLPATKYSLRVRLASSALGGCLAAVLFVGTPLRADADPVLAKVNGSEIHQSDVNLATEELGPSLAQMDPAAKQENVLSFLIDMKIIAKAAEEKKIENSEEFKKRLAFARDRLLMDRLLASQAKAAITDDAMKTVYADASKQITSEQEVHARHILVQTEDEAKKIEDELKKGADFVELAKKESKDPGASDGGDLGFFTKEQMVPEFSKVAFALEPGKISDPIKTQFGWHIIKVEEKRARKAPAFDEVKPQVEQFVTRKAQAEYVTKLREAAKVERMDKPAHPANASGDKANSATPADGKTPAKK
jgi:peptidyl-prolyl cis-trans isomerase C